MFGQSEFGVIPERVVRQPSSGVVVVVSVSVVLYFQRAGIQYIKSSAGKQVRIFIVAFSIRVGCKVRLKNAATAVGIVFVAFKDCAAGIN